MWLDFTHYEWYYHTWAGGLISLRKQAEKAIKNKSVSNTAT